MREINKIVIHCSDSKIGNAVMIDKWHRDRGWAGIGYHFVIGNDSKIEGLSFYDGRIEMGRPINKSGAHVRGHNSTSIGICLIGKPGEFTLKQLKAAKLVCSNLGHLWRRASGYSRPL
jgi:N-acetyl-anhydromuramyl-L-alanine amidase AmpD